MYNSTREFEACVLVNGKPVTEVVWRGMTYVEGRKKSNYELFFRNNSSQKVLVVPSVDGLSVIDGETAGKFSSGYVLEPWTHLKVPGWTINGREVAEFIFHAQGAYHSDEQTYAEEIGEDPDNQGVIGFMVFRQKFVRPRVRNVKSYTKPPQGGAGYFPQGYAGSGNFTLGQSDNSTLIGSSSIVSGTNTMGESSCSPDHQARTMGISSGSTTAVEGLDNVTVTNAAYHVGEAVADSYDPDEHKALGTGFGDAVEFETQTTEFLREATPTHVFAIYYDTLKNLRRAGVPVHQFDRHYSTSYSDGPNPFPDSPDVVGCTPPRGWTGRSRSRGRRKTRS
jgi:hypothetical protein